MERKERNKKSSLIRYRPCHASISRTYFSENFVSRLKNSFKSAKRPKVEKRNNDNEEPAPEEIIPTEEPVSCHLIAIFLTPIVNDFKSFTHEVRQKFC